MACCLVVRIEKLMISFLDKFAGEVVALLTTLVPFNHRLCLS
ncbi:hypothetical protein VC87395_002854 [Vibrio paracholerae 87395]|nr:hypothetical protein VC87395_002854 [Vibrio paracholerae 87395]